MTKLLVGVALNVFVAAAHDAFAQDLEKVRMVYASRSIPFLLSFVAKEKSFYRRHELDVELIQIASRLAVTAVATNEVDYSMNIGSSLRAATVPRRQPKNLVFATA
jgi:ABC-type nitrate/sulfonate/bicarbonate transport system substrate-binding protein